MNIGILTLRLIEVRESKASEEQGEIRKDRGFIEYLILAIKSTLEKYPGNKR